MFKRIGTILSLCCVASLVAMAKPAPDVPVTTIVSDYAEAVAPRLQIQSDHLGSYRNARTLTSVIQGIGDWVGYFQVDVRTGRAAPIVLIDSSIHESDYGTYDLSPDGRVLFYRHAPRGIVAHDIATGQETTVVDWKAQAYSGFFGFAVSPDGSSLAFGTATGQGPTLASRLRAACRRSASGIDAAEPA